MKPGDKVLRKWKPKYGEGKVMHVLGETIVVRWTMSGTPMIMFEKPKYLKKIDT